MRPDILVVDDRPANLLAMTRLLADIDATVHTASSGNEALGLTLEHDFALVLLDVQMPDMDGFETAELMRSNQETSHVPIIFVTAVSMEQSHVFKGYRTGAVDYLLKPIVPEILLTKMMVFLDLYRQKQELRETVRKLRESQKTIEMQNVVLKRLTIQDDLTGAYNRRHLNKMLTHEFYRCRRYEGDLSCIMLDLDHFKNVNDAHGHQFGDFVLKEVARRITCSSRTSDLVFRFGGEEFVVLMPQTDIFGTMQAAEKIRLGCAAEKFQNGSTAVDVTISIGASSFRAHQPAKPDDLISMADKALYEAKKSGRNQVVAFDSVLLEK
ncbi:MAG: diguanylate cyclase [Thermodesulfobacteriota bacterium]|nr:diguanylate cyclase [Thermodesulfobacteriota bacterium]